MSRFRAGASTTQPRCSKRWARRLEIDDQRADGHPIEHRFHGTSTELQEHAVRALRAHDIGVLVAPPGVGKTVAGIRMIAERARNTLVLVYLRPLLQQ